MTCMSGRVDIALTNALAPLSSKTLIDTEGLQIIELACWTSAEVLILDALNN